VVPVFCGTLKNLLIPVIVAAGDGYQRLPRKQVTGFAQISAPGGATETRTGLHVLWKETVRAIVRSIDQLLLLSLHNGRFYVRCWPVLSGRCNSRTR
jgi:hypothetical protein